MEGRKPTGVIVVVYSCKDPTATSKLDQWVDQTYIPALLATKAFSAVSRWANGNPEALPSDPQLGLILETKGDPTAARTAFHDHLRRWQQQGRMSPLLVGLKAMSFQHIAGPISRAEAIESPAGKEPMASWADYAARHHPEVLRKRAST